MATRIFGASDDLIELEGDVKGEVSAFGTDDADHGVLVVCSDGTVTEVKYGKNGKAIWEIKVLEKGQLFDRIEPGTDEDADPYSDQVFLREGLKWAYVAKDWERVK